MSNVSNKHKVHLGELNLPTRLLLGPGPSNIPPRVNLKMASPMVGYMDASYFNVMEEVKKLLRYLFQTDNDCTFPVSGAGSAAMEMCLANLIEPGDVVLVAISGYFSERIYDMAKRYGADVRRVEAAWGKWFTLQDLHSAMKFHKPSLLCIVNGETSTGIRQGIEGVSDLCREFNTLLMVDTVASLGAIPFYVDAWGVDACYTGGQKCVSAPPGISPITFSARSMDKIRARKTPVANWYLDASMLEQYWCPSSPASRKYHHTTSANLLYALREALVLICEEGLEAVWDRHASAARSLYEALNEVGLKCYVECESQDVQGGRLPSLTSIRVPDGVDAKEVQKHLLDFYGIEIAGGLGALAGKIWRVGLMGHNARSFNVKLLQVALKEALDLQK